MILCFGITPAVARTMQFTRLTIDGVNRTADVYDYAAGKSVNAARAIETLGEPALSVSVRGGERGRLLTRLVDSWCSQSEWVEVEPETRLCVTVVDREAHAATELVEESRPITVDDERRAMERFEARLGQARFVVLAGSMTPRASPDLYARCVRLATGAGKVALLDASGNSLHAAIAERPAVVKVNAGELAGLVQLADPSPGAVGAAADLVARRTGGWVVVTRGAEATIAAHAIHGRLLVTVPRVDVSSPIGSGDSFAGGLATGLTRGLEMREALRLATACASANAMTPHAAHFQQSVVDCLVQHVRVEPLV